MSKRTDIVQIRPRICLALLLMLTGTVAQANMRLRGTQLTAVVAGAAAGHTH